MIITMERAWPRYSMLWLSHGGFLCVVDINDHLHPILRFCISSDSGLHSAQCGYMWWRRAAVRQVAHWYHTGEVSSRVLVVMATCYWASTAYRTITGTYDIVEFSGHTQQQAQQDVDLPKKLAAVVAAYERACVGLKLLEKEGITEITTE